MWMKGLELPLLKTVTGIQNRSRSYFPDFRKSILFVANKFPFLNRYSDFIADISTTMTGSVLAQLLVFACAPIIARLFSPENFGVAALVASLGSIFYESSCLCYSHAIVLPKNETDAVKIMSLSLISLISMCVLLALCSAFIYAFAFEQQWIKSLGIWIFAVPLEILHGGLRNIFATWNTRKAKFVSVAKSQVSAVLASRGFKIGSGLVAGSSVFGLIVGDLLGSIASIRVLLKAENNSIIPNLFKVNRKEIYQIAKEYRDFPLYQMPTSLMSDFSQNLVVIMLAYFFPAAVIGYYAMSNRLLRKPIKIVIVSLRRVYMQKAAALKNMGRPLTGSFIKTTVGLALCGCLPFFILFLWGEQIMSLLLGDKWITAGIYTSILAPWLFTTFLLAPSNTIMLVTRKNKLRFYYQIFDFVFKGVSLIVGFKLYNRPEPVLLIFSLTSTFTNFVYIAMALWIAKQMDFELSTS